MGRAIGHQRMVADAFALLNHRAARRNLHRRDSGQPAAVRQRLPAWPPFVTGQIPAERALSAAPAVNTGFLRAFGIRRQLAGAESGTVMALDISLSEHHVLTIPG